MFEHGLILSWSKKKRALSSAPYVLGLVLQLADMSGGLGCILRGLPFDSLALCIHCCRHQVVLARVHGGGSWSRPSPRDPLPETVRIPPFEAPSLRTDLPC